VTAGGDGPAERRGGKAAGELSERVNAPDALERVRHGNVQDDGEAGFKAASMATCGSQQSGVTVGPEVRASPRGRKSGDDSHRRRESFEGQRDIAGIRSADRAAAMRPDTKTGETTMNPRVVSRCNSADRIDEEKTGEVA